MHSMLQRFGRVEMRSITLFVSNLTYFMDFVSNTSQRNEFYLNVGFKKIQQKLEFVVITTFI